MRGRTDCFDCGAAISPANGRQRCNACRFDGPNHRFRTNAHRMVAMAVQAGLLPSLKDQHVACVDCGVRADRYDHRDYSKPLTVDPTCRKCDRKRGPAPLNAALKAA
jgi:hypothetical protein